MLYPWATCKLSNIFNGSQAIPFLWNVSYFCSNIRFFTAIVNAHDYKALFLENPLSAILSLQTIAAGKELHACLVEGDTLTFSRRRGAVRGIARTCWVGTTHIHTQKHTHTHTPFLTLPTLQSNMLKTCTFIIEYGLSYSWAFRSCSTFENCKKGKWNNSP